MPAAEYRLSGGRSWSNAQKFHLLDRVNLSLSSVLIPEWAVQRQEFWSADHRGHPEWFGSPYWKKYLEEVSGVDLWLLRLMCGATGDGGIRLRSRLVLCASSAMCGSQVRWALSVGLPPLSISIVIFAGGRQRLRFSTERCKSSPTFKICEARRWHKRSFFR